MRSPNPSALAPLTRRRDRSGFTILEIMIATAILTMGLLGILALFPVAIDSGRKVMERSTAVTIAKSVAEEIRAGLRNQKRTVYKGTIPFTYFVFMHDGVEGSVPSAETRERPDGAYYVLLPQFKPEVSGQGGSDEQRRIDAKERSKEFVYPETDPVANGNGDAFAADDDGDDLGEYATGAKGILVKKTYSVGQHLLRKGTLEGQLLADMRTDVLNQYSYAFSIRASMYDSNLSFNPGRFEPGNELYSVRIMIFRSFTFNEQKVRVEGKGVEPVYEMDFEVCK